MWRRARLCFSPPHRGKCALKQHYITRYLRVQCTDRHPRAHAGGDVRQTRHGGAKEELPHALTAAAASKDHNRDRRSMGSIDPVVLKYTNMINELRSQTSRVEKVNETHFGSIRFDSENIPRLHGHFDIVHEPLPPDSKQVSSQDLHTNVSTNTYQHDTQPLQQELVNSVTYKTAGHDRGLNNGLNEPEDTLSTVQSKEHGNEGSMNTDASIGKQEDQVIGKEYPAHDMNYIDECMFGDSLHSSGLNSEPVRNLQSTTSNEHVQEPFGKEDMHMNYIDKVFFQTSFENVEENKTPTIEYSEIKKKLERLVVSEKELPVSEENKYDDPNIQVSSQLSQKTESETFSVKDKYSELSKNSEDTKTSPKSAFEYVRNLREEEHKTKYGISEAGDGSKKSYKKILSLVDEKTKHNHTEYEIMKLLKSSVIYDNHDIVGLYKPYGLAMHGGTSSRYHVISEYLPELATFLGTDELYPVHRLDATTTGVLLLARTPFMANTLRDMFKARQLKKTYWAVTRGIPNPLQGVIDIPIAEGIVDGRRRMVLKPDVKGLKSTTSSSKMAVTRFKVMAKRDSSALVELFPMTGVKHQLRVHLGFGLSCPILGDHKYSHTQKLVPQKLPGDMLHSLRMKQSKVRHLPIFLHCKSILVPEVVDGRNIFISAKVPAFYNKTLSLLKLNRHASKVQREELIASPT